LGKQFGSVVKKIFRLALPPLRRTPDGPRSQTAAAPRPAAAEEVPLAVAPEPHQEVPLAPAA